MRFQQHGRRQQQHIIFRFRAGGRRTCVELAGKFLQSRPIVIVQEPVQADKNVPLTSNFRIQRKLLQ